MSCNSRRQNIWQSLQSDGAISTALGPNAPTVLERIYQSPAEEEPGDRLKLAIFLDELQRRGLPLPFHGSGAGRSSDNSNPLSEAESELEDDDHQPQQSQSLEKLASSLPPATTARLARVQEVLAAARNDKTLPPLAEALVQEAKKRQRVIKLYLPDASSNSSQHRGTASDSTTGSKDKLGAFVDEGNVTTAEANSRNVVQLGKGLFSTAFREVGTDRVITISAHDRQGQPDLGKAVLAELTSYRLNNPHLPQVQRQDEPITFAGQLRTVFETRLSGDLSTKKHPEAARQLRVLQKTLEQARLEIYQESAGQVEDYEINQRFVEKLEQKAQDGKIPPSLYEAVDQLHTTALNISENLRFEFPRQNVGVDKAGNLILRDVLFDSEQAAYQRRNLLVA